jgi:hypothetical protein
MTDNTQPHRAFALILMGAWCASGRKLIQQTLRACVDRSTDYPLRMRVPDFDWDRVPEFYYPLDNRWRMGATILRPGAPDYTELLSAAWNASQPEKDGGAGQ